MAQKITLNELRKLVKQVIKENQEIDSKENLKWFFLFNDNYELYEKMDEGEEVDDEIEKSIKYLRDEGIEYDPNIDYKEEYKIRHYNPDEETDEDKMVIVSTYETSQRYGGPEEGGWYYTNRYLIDSKKMPLRDAKIFVDKVREENRNKYDHTGKVVAFIEKRAGQYEKTGTEYYS